MIKIEGRIAVGLDEFMLRLGHLKMLLRILPAASGNRQRVARRLAQELTEPVEVREKELEDVGQYLVRKELSVVRRPDGSTKEPHDKARYRGLEVHLRDDGTVERLLDPKSSGASRIWFQDMAIAERRTRSKVGAVTVDVEQISNKSGVSHLVDWAVILGIANNHLGLTAVGRALKTVCDATEAEDAQTAAQNPYIIGVERLVFVWMLARADGDILSLLAPALCQREETAKASAVELAHALAESLAKQVALRKEGPCTNAVKALRSLKEDLGILIPSRRGRARQSSTAWHRISSRLETMTDLGLLDKTDRDGISHDFEYYYRPTDALRLVKESMDRAATADEWASEHAVDVVAKSLDLSLKGTGCEEELYDATRRSMSVTGVHIGAFSLVASAFSLLHGKRLTIIQARRALEQLAIRHPDIARLSRGYVGSGAEFASIIMSKLEAVGPAAYSLH